MKSLMNDVVNAIGWVIGILLGIVFVPYWVIKTLFLIWKKRKLEKEFKEKFKEDSIV